MIKTPNDYKIVFVRGDTFQFGMEMMTEGGTAFVLDDAYFTARSTWDGTIAFQVRLGNGIYGIGENKYIVRIAPEKTANLDPGRYVYDLQLVKDGDVITPLRGHLLLAEDATY